MWLQLQLHLVVFTKHRISYIYIYITARIRVWKTYWFFWHYQKTKSRRYGWRKIQRLNPRKAEQYSLKVEILKGIIMRDKALLPRISFGLSETLQLHFVLIRKQLRTVRTFAMSVNKSQGQIFKHDLFLRVFFFLQMVVCYHVTFQKW